MSFGAMETTSVNEGIDIIKKIGIMGGTFDPIHVGHLLLAETALSEEKLDGIMFLPSGQPYMKKENGVSDSFHRLQMVKLAIADNPSFFVSDMEISRTGNTYTCDTLEKIKQEKPLNESYFIMGADCLYTIEKWKNPQKIFDYCTILTAVRNGIDNSLIHERCNYLTSKYHAKIRLLSFPETAISSTHIKQLIKDGKSIRYMVPETVRKYIEENGLYR